MRCNALVNFGTSRVIQSGDTFNLVRIPGSGRAKETLDRDRTRSIKHDSETGLSDRITRRRLLGPSYCPELLPDVGGDIGCGIVL